MNKRTLKAAAAVLALCVVLAVTGMLSACSNKESSPGVSKNSSEPTAQHPSESASEQTSSSQEEHPAITKGDITSMKLSINGKNFTATLANNQAAHELAKMIQDKPMTLSLSDYSGFEKVGSLGTSLTTSDAKTTTHSGDIVLYRGNQIVLFYGSNTWSYTKLATVDSLSGWEDALGTGDVSVTLCAE